MAKIKNISNAEICRALVTQLESELLQFKDICMQVPVETVDPKLRTAIYELGISIIHFIDQYRMTDGSISDINKLPGRKKKAEERAYFRQEVTEYQKKFPNKFPSWDTFSKGLDALNIKRTKENMPELIVESRTYDVWKKWWKNNEFDHLVHD